MEICLRYFSFLLILQIQGKIRDSQLCPEQLDLNTEITPESSEEYKSPGGSSCMYISKKSFTGDPDIAFNLALSETHSFVNIIKMIELNSLET